MKLYSFERGGITEMLPMAQILGLLNSDDAASLYENMAVSQSVRLRLKDFPFTAVLKHEENFEPVKPVEGTVPGYYCVEIVWHNPVESKVTIRAVSAEEAEQKVREAIYGGEENPIQCPGIFDDIQEACENFRPEASNAEIFDVMPINREAFADIRGKVIEIGSRSPL